MQLDALTICYLSRELADRLEGTRVIKALEPSRGRAVFLLEREKTTLTLICSTDPALQLIYLSWTYKAKRSETGPFAERFNKAASGSSVRCVKVASEDRVLVLKLDGKFSRSGKDRQMNLYFYMTGSGGNIILKDVSSKKRICSLSPPARSIKTEELKLIDPSAEPLLLSVNNLDQAEANKSLAKLSWNSLIAAVRPAVYGSSYSLAATISCLALERKKRENEDSGIGFGWTRVIYQTAKMLARADSLPTAVFDSSIPGKCAFFPVDPGFLPGAERVTGYDISDLLEKVSAREAGRTTRESKQDETSSRLIVSLEKYSRKLEKRLKKINADLEETASKEIVREKAVLLLANASKEIKGKEEITFDRISATGETLNIKLDPKLTVAENAGAYFKKYRKLKNGKSIMRSRLEETMDLKSRIEEIIGFLKNDEASPERIEEAKSLLGGEGSPRSARPDQKSGGKSEERVKYRKFVIKDGWELLVGKSAKDNDSLTFKTAASGDIWLHAEGTAGSHAIIKRAGKKDPPSAGALEEAASITAFYSSSRYSALVPVIVAEKRYVRRVRGAPPGTALYSKSKTIFAEPKDPTGRTDRNRESGS